MKVLFDLDRVERLRTAVERASVTVTSADHAVLVTVGAGGAITELELTNQAVRRGGHAVAALITDTVRRATAELAETLATELEEFTDGRADPAALLSGALPTPQRPGQPAQPAPSGDDDSGQPAEEAPGSALMERLRTESARSLDGYAELRDELAELTSTARSPDGAITVTVRSGGAIDTLHIDDSALRHGPGNLGRLVLATIQRARADSALQAAERVQGLTGLASLSPSIRDMVESAIPPELRPDTDTDRATGGRR